MEKNKASLEEARQVINRIDKQMAELFEERMQAVEQVALYKIAHNLPVYDPERERFMIDRNCRFINNPAYLEYYNEYLQQLMQLSKRYQNSIVHQDVVAYQGQEGAYSHIAAKTLFPYNRLTAHTTFEDIFQAVTCGEAAVGVIPFENSYSGDVGEVLDLLMKYDCYINDIYDLRINHHLVAGPGATLKDIKQVYSHPQAISQCQAFIKENHLEAVPYANTAQAAQYVSGLADLTKAAIASEDTANLYHLQILVKNINTSAENTTRFIIIQKDLQATGNRFNLLFTVKHDAGQLAKIMQVIGDLGFNLESIKSRPLHNLPWQYYFYVEIVGDLRDDKSKELLALLEKHCQKLKVLGVYSKK